MSLMTGAERNKLKDDIRKNIPNPDNGKRQLIVEIMEKLLTDEQLEQLHMISIQVKSRWL